MAFEPVRRVAKDHASCAIFGAVAFNGKPVLGELAITGICEAEIRGGAGSGLLMASTQRGTRGKVVSVIAQEDQSLDAIRSSLLAAGVHLSNFLKTSRDGNIYEAVTEAEYLPLLAAVAAANASISPDLAHIISFGHGLRLYKGLERMHELDIKYNLSVREGSAVIAHTRFPTGSHPKAIRAHPFSFGNVGIVHNGDVTSYRANLATCEAMLAEIYSRYGRNGVEQFMVNLRKSWVGNDSEVIAGMMYAMLKVGLVSEPGLSVPSIMNTLVPPFDNSLTRLLRGSDERARLDALALRYHGAALDGPVSSIAVITYEDDVHFLAFRDRNTFRPLQIVIDHESGIAYAASELRQIVAATGIDITSHKVESFSPDPGKFLWVSAKSGIVTTGRKHRAFISVPNSVGPTITGKPNQFAGDTINDHQQYTGILGTFGGSYSNGDGTLELFGSMQDNCFEASSLARVLCHGNASMMLGNAFQGRQFFVRGSVDSRAFQQLRPKDGHTPVAIVGETAGQYLGKMMSGGVIMALGLQHLGREDVDTPIVGEFVGTGMVGGRIFVRGHLIDDYIKCPPSRRDVISVCADLKAQGVITDSDLHEIRHDTLNFERIKGIVKDPVAIERLAQLFDQTLSVERRALNETEIAELMPHLEQYFADFGLDRSWLDAAIKSEYTIISVKH